MWSFVGSRRITGCTNAYEPNSAQEVNPTTARVIKPRISKVIDGWRDQGPTPYTYSTTLSAGALSDIELHYYEHEGGAACRLQWSYPGQVIQVIPQSQLFP